MPKRTCFQHSHQPDPDCKTCLGDENVRLRQIIAVVVWKAGGKVVITDEDALALPPSIKVREYVNEKREAVIEIVPGILRPGMVDYVPPEGG